MKYSWRMLFNDFKEHYPDKWRRGTTYEPYDHMTIIISIPILTAPKLIGSGERNGRMGIKTLALSLRIRMDASVFPSQKTVITCIICIGWIELMQAQLYILLRVRNALTL